MVADFLLRLLAALAHIDASGAPPAQRTPHGAVYAPGSCPVQRLLFRVWTALLWVSARAARSRRMRSSWHNT
jgi:hypothetical protein